jgi:hypothetical protein
MYCLEKQRRVQRRRRMEKPERVADVRLSAYEYDTVHHLFPEGQ